MAARRGLFPALLVGLALCQASPADGAETPFSVVHRAQGRVAVAYAANGLVSCDGDDANCRGVRNGIVQLQNTQLDMAFIDVDPLALGDLDGDGRDDTVNSSAAMLDLPDGARIEFARLYVAGIWRTDNANACGEPRAVPVEDRTTVRFAPPGEAYITLQGALIGDDAQALGAGYAATFDVAPHLDGGGEVWVADAALLEGRCAAGGWALAVAYRTDDGPARSVILNAGYVAVAELDLEVDFDGLLTPPGDPTRVTLAVGAVEGDRGLDEDAGWLGETPLSDALNPADDLFNSTIGHEGRNRERRTPAHLNNIAYDFDVIDATGALAPDARASGARFTAGRDVVKAFFVGLSADLSLPALTLSKSARVQQGAPEREVGPGDRIEYTLELEAAAANNDDAVDPEIDDPLPIEVAWLPGTVAVQRGRGNFDPPADGEVVYDADAHRLTASPPAALAPGDVFAVRFEVEVLPSARRMISNSATLAWSGATAGPGLVLESRTDSDPDQPGDQPTAVAVAPVPDMAPPLDMAVDGDLLDAAVEPPADGAAPDVDPPPDADSEPQRDAAEISGDADVDANPVGLLAEGEDVAGGIIFGCEAGDGAGHGLWLLTLLLLAARRRWGAVALLALAVLPRPAAAAERFDVQRFAPAADLRHHGLRLMSARPSPGPRWSAGLLLDHADDPLTVEVDGERTRSLVARQTRAHLVASGAFTEAFEVGVAVPVMLDASGDGAVGGPGLGDMRVQGRVVLWNPDEDPTTAVALVVDGYLGTGDIDAFHGDVGRRVETRVAVAHRLGDIDLRINAGWLSRGAARLGNLDVDDALTLGLGAEIPLAEGWALLPEIDGGVTLTGDLGLAELPFEALVGARYLIDDAWSAVGAVGAGLLPGVGVPDLRIVLGFTYTRALDDARPAPEAP